MWPWNFSHSIHSDTVKEDLERSYCIDVPDYGSFRDFCSMAKSFLVTFFRVPSKNRISDSVPYVPFYITLTIHMYYGVLRTCSEMIICRRGTLTMQIRGTVITASSFYGVDSREPFLAVSDYT